MVLNDAEFLHRNADTGCDHRHMQMDTDGLGMHGDHAVLSDIAIAVIRFEVQMRLT